MRRILLLAFLVAALPAQDLSVKGAPQDRVVVLKNGIVHTLQRGVVLGGTIWFDGGVIRGVLAKDEPLQLPAGKEPLVVDLHDRHVYPGLIAANTVLGLKEYDLVKQTNDTAEIGTIAPEAMASVAVNPDSAVLPVTRSNGVLAAAVFPVGGLLPGRAAVIQLDGWTNADMAVKADAGLAVAWPAEPEDNPFGGMRGRRGGAAAAAGDDPATAVKKQRRAIDDAFARAAAWQQAKAADPQVATDLRWQAMGKALRGEVPTFVFADEREQIESAVIWARSRNLKPVIVGGRDAALCVEILKLHDVPVIVNGTFALPKRDDSGYDERFSLPRRLHDAGVRFCIASGEPFYNERNLPYAAAIAVAFGLDREAALAAITADAATILGVGDRLGTLTVGKDATLFVADGSPLELTTKIELAFVRGRQVDLRNKHTELAKKYREKYRQAGAGK
jgi:imidazolonepropionase-like amidohydrolase